MTIRADYRKFENWINQEIRTVWNILVMYTMKHLIIRIYSRYPCNKIVIFSRNKMYSHIYYISFLSCSNMSNTYICQKNASQSRQQNSIFFFFLIMEPQYFQWHGIKSLVLKRQGRWKRKRWKKVKFFLYYQKFANNENDF